jgi:hypothetical protein
MNKKRALTLLEKMLDEIPRLRNLLHENKEYKTWDQNVIKLIKETYGNNSNEYARYNGAFLLTYAHTEQEKQQAYINFLNQRETALKSIIQGNKTLYQKIWNEIKDIITSIIAKFAAEKTKGA